jgi:hypothetical protein
LLLNFLTVMTECGTMFFAVVCRHVPLMIYFLIKRLRNDNPDLDIDGSVH